MIPLAFLNDNDDFQRHIVGILGSFGAKRFRAGEFAVMFEG